MNVLSLAEAASERKENLTSHKATRAETRAAIDAAIATDPTRSARSIAGEIGCDHKTVRARRGEIQNSPVGKLQRGNSPALEAPAAIRSARDDFDWSVDPMVLREQLATAIYFNDTGDLVIRQKQWPGEDNLIFVAPNCQQEFIDKLTDALGIPSFGGPTR
ncbi:hypothetical protein H8B02_22680 [Bradyrhizobium sp. Pear77]|uniref:hypothetical protein n=1 Tax=Bradyrhizobium altum TaxID=1571202 RepID=UPI001E4270D1|nr:hypothetical protein [Bradyrhizobium altum]MCC8956133.1 hypothetical protein [Bradyrhizobium altum]